MADIIQLRKQTETEALDGLDKYGKFCIIRPTGFGKTGILTAILKRYKHVLYLYPTDAVCQAVCRFYYGPGHENDDIPNVEFMSYMKLVRLTDDDFDKLEEPDLIICDEAHRLGGAKTIIGMMQLTSHFPNANLLGATASPERMDSIDEISIFFDDRISSEYTLHDAFQDGIIQKPIYIYHSYYKDEIKDVEKAAKLEIRKFKDAALETPAYDLLKSRLIEIANLGDMSNIIKKACNEHADTDDYRKFIVFCASYDHLHAKQKIIEGWFKKAFPNDKVRTLVITGETSKTAKNIKKLPDVCYAPHTTDLILCCDMLNMAYHVNDITGVMFYRGTGSGIIYIQQLGRVLSTGDLRPKLVFDIVDNLHRKALYDVSYEESDIFEGMDDPTSVNPPKKGLDSKDSKQLVAIRNAIRDYKKKAMNNNLSDHEKAIIQKTLIALHNSEQKILNQANVDTKWTHNINIIFPQDLVIDPHMATYRELIAKTVAEPISQRCRLAVAMWKKHGGILQPKTRDAWLAQKSPDGTPLLPFARLKQVSINAILDEEGVV